VVVCLLMVELALGVVARNLPQMSMLILVDGWSLVLKALVGSFH
jgi:flagellar biosynthesis protein FliR